MDYAERLLSGIVDFIYSKYPRSVPEKERLKNCKIVSHRGEHDNRSVFENTLNAFEKAASAGVYGIEFDIRWTKDLKPVVLHDPDTKRLYKKDMAVSETVFPDLSKAFPEIPSLEEIIGRYGKKVHLMAEIKMERYPEPSKQKGILKELFSGLEPAKDYHFISLAPEMFGMTDFAPNSALIPIARLNVKSISRTALRKNYGGIAGHYLLVTNSYIGRHLEKNQKTGTGFVESKNSLFREINRGVEWVFSNSAVNLQTIINKFQG